jgi:hypothetical protein
MQVTTTLKNKGIGSIEYQAKTIYFAQVSFLSASIKHGDIVIIKESKHENFLS